MLTLSKFALTNKINLFGLMATLFIGQNKVFLPETDSTNSYAISLLKNVNCPEGTVVYTHNQTAGRGQRGNGWIADPTLNITLSLVIKPVFLAPKNAFYLSKITALALYDVLTEILADGQFDIKIKWPNDILVNSKKIAGVLIENSFSEQQINWSVIGLGLNVKQTYFGSLNKSATSLALLGNDESNPDLISEKFFVFFEKWYLKLKQNKLTEISDSYHLHLFGIMQLMRFNCNYEEFKATVKGVNEQGLLQLVHENGEEKSYDIKSLSFIIHS